MPGCSLQTLLADRVKSGGAGKRSLAFKNLPQQRGCAVGLALDCLADGCEHGVSIMAQADQAQLVAIIGGQLDLPLLAAEFPDKAKRQPADRAADRQDRQA